MLHPLFGVTPIEPSVIATGSTTARTLAARFGEVANVLDYGAVGDGVADDGVAIQAALDSGRNLVWVPEGTYLFATGLTPPNDVSIICANRREATFRYTGTGVAITFGTSDTVLNTGCSLSHCRILLVDKASTAIKLNATNGAVLEDIYMEALFQPFDNTRTNIGVVIDGANISAFFNSLENISCSHFHEGFRITTTGTTQATSQHFRNCTTFGDKATDNTSIGYNILNNGDGAIIVGGNIESCNQGMRFGAAASSVSSFGVRFESNTTDIIFDSGAKTSTFIGLTLIVPANITNSSGNDQSFIACIDLSKNDFTQMIGSSKVWAEFTETGTVNASQNVSSITDSGIGDWTVNLTISFSSGSYAAIAVSDPTSSSANNISTGIQQTSTADYRVRSENSGGIPTDPDATTIWTVAFGDQ